MSASSVGRPSWSELPPELIRSISTKTTDIADYVRLRAVCKPWRSAAAKPDKTFARPQTIPWLLLPYDPASSSRSFFSLSSHETFDFDLPQFRGKLTYGSPHGWLVVVDEVLNVALLDPISGRLVRLPAINRFPDFATFRFDRRDDGGGEELVYWRRGGVSGKVNYDMIWHILFCCVFMSSSSSSLRGADDGAEEEEEEEEYVVTITSYLSPRFLCYRSVDEEWTMVDSTLTCGVDCLTRHDDKLFLAGIDGSVVVCDLYPHLQAELVSSLRIPGDFHCCCYFGTVRGKLLLAIDSMKPQEDEKEKKINVFELDMDGSDESSRKKKEKKKKMTMRWAKVEDVGDCTLLLTENHRIAEAAGGRGAFGYGGDYVCFRAVRREVEGKRVETEVVQVEEEGFRVLSCDWVTEMEALGPAWFAPALF